MSEMILISKITPAPFQPRKKFDEGKMQELADSMKEQGLIQAITVRPLDGGYQLIAGERRFRAAKKLGWNEINAEVQQMDDLEAEEKSAVENIQRMDLEGQELEDVVSDLWEKGKDTRYCSTNERYPNGRPSMELLAKALGLKRQWINDLVSAKKDRTDLDLRSNQTAFEKPISTHVIRESGVVLDPERRKALIERVVKKEPGKRINVDEMKEYGKVLDKAPEIVAKEVLDNPEVFTPEIAKHITELPTTAQQKQVIAEVKSYDRIAKKHAENRVEDARLAEKGVPVSIYDPIRQEVELCRNTFFNVTKIQASSIAGLPEPAKKECKRWLFKSFEHLQTQLGELGEMSFQEIKL